MALATALSRARGAWTTYVAAPSAPMTPIVAGAASTASACRATTPSARETTNAMTVASAKVEAAADRLRGRSDALGGLGPDELV